MATDYGSIFDGEQAPTDEAVAAPEVVEEVAAQEPEQAETQEQEPEVVVEQAEETVQPERVEGGRTVPLDALKEEREKRQAIEREYRALKAQLDQPAKPANVPDPFDDPKGFAAYQSEQFQSAILTERFTMSDIMAKQAHGEDVVQEAAQWAIEKSQADPTFYQRYISQPHPIDWIVRQHKQDGLVSQIGDDPDAWVRKRAAELGLTAAPVAAAAPVVAAPQQQASPPARVPRSIANEGSGGSDIRHVPTGPLAGVDAVFG